MNALPNGGVSPDGQRTLRLVLMGTGPFAVPAFEALLAAGHSVVLVVTRPERIAKSRKGPPPAPVRQFAAQHGLPLFDPPSANADDVVQRLSDCHADLLVVCDYGQILSSPALGTTRLGGINLHGSLLPRYRGAAPVQWAVLSGDVISGVSVIHMTPRLDGGPILATAQTEIQPQETAGQLEHRLSQLGVQPTLDSVQQLIDWDGQSVLGQPQDPSLVTRAPRLDKSQGQIDWSQSATQIDCHVRGMQPWPGAFTDLAINGTAPLRIAIRGVTVWDSEVSDGLAAHGAAEPSESHLPGTLLVGAELLVATGRGMLRIDRLQVAGRSEVDGAAFLRGTRVPTGSRFT